MPVLSQLLGKRSLLVLRFASCQAVMDEGGLPEHRSERQAPRRRTRTIIPNAVAEPPCERSVFGEPDLRLPGPGFDQAGRQPARRTSSTRRIASSTSHVVSASTIRDRCATHSTTVFWAEITVEWLRRPK